MCFLKLLLRFVFGLAGFHIYLIKAWSFVMYVMWCKEHLCGDSLGGSQHAFLGQTDLTIATPITEMVL